MKVGRRRFWWKRRTRDSSDVSKRGRGEYWSKVAEVAKVIQGLLGGLPETAAGRRRAEVAMTVVQRQQSRSARRVARVMAPG